MGDSSWFGLGETYRAFWEMIIRPPRDEYDLSEFGPERFRLRGQSYERKDLQLKNDRGLLLECSHFVPRLPSAEGKPRPCVIYLHGNSSSRLEACDVLPFLLPKGITLFCMDLSGSGRSQGDYISLGYFEQRDVLAAVEYLRGQGSVGAVGLWGRSMGAATAVLRAAEDPNIGACVMDSAFSSFPTVADELISSGAIPIPAFVLRLAFRVIHSEVKERAGFDMYDLQPIEKAPAAVAPGLFATAEDDKLVQPHHSRALHDAWGGDCELVTFGGGHDGQRPQWFLEHAAAFLEENLGNARPGKPSRRGPAQTKTARDPISEASQAASSSSGLAGGIFPSGIFPSGIFGGAGAATADVSAELAAMGFEPELVSEAARRHSNVQAAVDWIVELSAEAAQALSGAHFEVRPPNTLRGVDAEVESGAPARPAARAAAEGRATAERLERELQDMGFTPEQARQAARRCSSMEAAVDWLSTRSDLT